ncbi:MAG: hypothetical protein KGL59_06530 [Acidobacteriota bacterium]|nr:hypothetical protein [Acidobacteriota bacterium]
MFSRLSALMSALAIVVIVTFIVVVIVGSRRSSPGRPSAATPSRVPAAPPADHPPEVEPEVNASAVTPAVHVPTLSLGCIVERIRNAPTPFHWSYKRDATGVGSTDWEADISADSISGTLVDGSGTYPIQAARSDSAAWKTAVSVLTAPLPRSTFALLEDSPAPAPAAVEMVGSEYTVKYRIDTARATPAGASSIRKALGPKGFVNGAVWVDRDGCPVRFVLDVEEQLADGSVKKSHYAGGAIAR